VTHFAPAVSVSSALRRLGHALPGLIHRVGDTVFLEASLTNGDGELAAISTATAQVIQLAEGRDAA